MTIKSHAGPIDGRAVMQQALATRVPQAEMFSTPLGGAPQTGSPVPFYHLSLDALTEPNPLEFATMTGWQYPVVGGIDPGLADIRDVPDGPSSFAGLSHGLLAQRFIQASLLAEQALAAQAEEYQPRLLDIPALQFAALWLYGTTTSYFVSLLDGRPAGTAPLKLVTEIMSDLKARADSRSHGLAPLGGGSADTPTN